MFLEAKAEGEGPLGDLPPCALGFINWLVVGVSYTRLWYVSLLLGTIKVSVSVESLRPCTGSACIEAGPALSGSAEPLAGSYITRGGKAPGSLVTPFFSFGFSFEILGGSLGYWLAVKVLTTVRCFFRGVRGFDGDPFAAMVPVLRNTDDGALSSFEADFLTFEADFFLLKDGP